MAMTRDGNLERVLNRRAAWTAGIVCAVAALLAAAAVVALMVTRPDAGALVLAHLGGWAALWVLMAVAGVQLALGSANAQRLLLVFWLLVAVVAGIAALTGQVRGADWWTLPAPLWAIVAAALTGAVVCAALLVAASAERSPLRYASYVAVSIAVAVALTITVNLIAQDAYVHRDLQQLGRYGLSERTRKVLATLQTPVRLTCVYTSTDPQARGTEYRPAVLELLNDMQEANSHVTVANAATESAKATVVARLRGELGGQADKHVRFLTDFTHRAKELSEALTTEQARWSGLGDESYLSMWALTAQVPAGLAQGAQQIDTLRARVAGELAGQGLLDYAGLADEVTRMLAGLTRDLGDEARVLAAIAGIPQAAAANRKDVLAKLDAMRQAVAELNASLAGDKAAKASAATLDEVAAKARDATAKALAAAKVLRSAGGAANARYVLASRYYQLSIPAGDLEVRADLARFIEQYVAVSLQQVAEAVEAIRKVAKPEYYSSSAVKLQAAAAELTELVDKVAAAGREALDKLIAVDEPTRPVLQLAQAGQLFQGPLEIASLLLTEAQALPKLSGGSLAADIVGDNIVILEAAGKTAVVPFDEVWPLRPHRGGVRPEAETDQPAPRVFQGDPAISSRILSMTTEPFATVVLTYYGGTDQAARMTPRADIAPDELGALRKRLSEANFEVTEWNLSEPRPAETPGRPAVLLVLPPPPALPAQLAPPEGGFGPEHVQKVAAAVDAGTPAIFLTQFLWPRQLPFMPPLSPTYEFADYLKSTWGVDVRCNYLVIPAVADETQPGLYRLAPARFTFMPLSAFTSHPIGRPLQAQRVLWTALAPILTVPARPAGVSVEAVLQVPADWQSTWATQRLMDLQAQLETQSATIRPDYAAGDVPAPFAVIVAATRSGRARAAEPTTTTTAASMPGSSPAAAASRIVVMTVGGGLVDGYLDQRVGQLDARNTLVFSDPPRANADVVINSVYWLIGREAMIAAGPAQVRPVAMIPATTMNLLRVVTLIALPAAVVLIGAAVLLARRR